MRLERLFIVKEFGELLPQLAVPDPALHQLGRFGHGMCRSVQKQNVGDGASANLRAQIGQSAGSRPGRFSWFGWIGPAGRPPGLKSMHVSGPEQCWKEPRCVCSVSEALRRVPGGHPLLTDMMSPILLRAEATVIALLIVGQAKHSGHTAGVCECEDDALVSATSLPNKASRDASSIGDVGRSFRARQVITQTS